METESPEPVSEQPSLLQRIRSMREFAAFMQYLFFFGKAVKIDDMEVEVRTGASAEAWPNDR